KHNAALSVIRYGKGIVWGLRIASARLRNFSEHVSNRFFRSNRSVYRQLAQMPCNACSHGSFREGHALEMRVKVFVYFLRHLAKGALILNKL
ncbi:MAG: hypothetical protein RL664_479, partial [Bacteroidota bacterium]